MLDYVRSILSPPSFEDEDQTRIGRFLHAIILILVTGGILYVLFVLILQFGPLNNLPYVTVAVVFLVGLLWLIHQDRLRLVEYLLLAGLWAILTLAAIGAGGVQSPAYTSLILVVLAATLLLGGQVGLFVTGICVLTGAGLLMAEQQGLLPVPFHTSSTHWLAKSVLFFVAGILLAFFNRDLKTALRTSRGAVSDLRKAQEDLRASEERLQLFFSQSLDGFFFSMLDEAKAWNDTVDKEAVLDYIMYHERITEANDAMIAQYGSNRTDFLGRTVMDFFAHDPAQARDLHRGLFDAGRVHLETEERKDDGTPIFVEGDYVAMYDGQGCITGMFGIQRDISDRRRAEITLKKNEEFLSIVYKNSDMGIFVVNVTDNGEYVYEGINPTHEKLVGLKNENAAGKTPDDLVEHLGAETVHYIKTLYDECVQKRETVESEFYVPQGPAQGWWFSRLTPVIHEKTGNVERLIGSGLVITERKRIEDALRESETSLRESQRIAHVGQWSWDTETNVVTWSDEMKRIFGLDPETFTGDLDKIVARAIHPDDQMKVNAANEAVLTEKRPGPLEYRIVWPDQSVRTVLAIPGDKVVDASGKIIKLSGIVQDITERKRSEEALRASEERFRTLVEAMDDVIFTLDVQQRHTGVYGRWLERMGMTPEQFLGRTYEDILGEEQAAVHSAANERALQGEHVVYEWSAPGLQGMSYFQTSLSPLRDTAGKVTGIVGVGRDITGIKRAEQALRESEARLELFFSQSLDGFFFMMLDEPVVWNDSVDKEKTLDYVFSHQRITKINDAMLHQYRATREQFIGLSPNDLFAHNVEQGRRIWRAFFDAGHMHIDTDERRMDGSQIWVEGDYVCMYDAQERIIGHFGIQRDVTVQKSAEEALQKSEDRYRRIVEISPDAIFINKNDQVTYINSAGLRLFGADWPGQIIGKSPFELFHPDYHAIIRERIGSMLQEGMGVPLIEEKIVRLDGTTLDVEVTATPFYGPDGPAIQVILHDITERKQAEEELRIQLERLASLRAIDTAISTSTDLRIIFYILLSQTLARLKVDAAAILLYDPITNSLNVGAAQGFHTSEIQRVRIRMGEGFAGRAALERTMIEGHSLSPAELASSAPYLAGEGFSCYYAIPLIGKGQVMGVFEVFKSRHYAHDRDWMDFLNTLAGQAAIALENASLFSSLQRSNNDLRHAYETTLEGWSHALDLRDKETEGHTQRVTRLTLQIAEAVGIRGEEILNMRRGALLHDIGKMGVPDRILHKRGPLTAKEWKAMRRHPEFAYQLLTPIAYLKDALAIPYCHHEKWDGSGYPRGLRGEQIPLAARIFAVADVYDALTSDRPYRKAWKKQQALEYIQEQAGTHFDRHIVETFMLVVQTDDP